MKIALGADHAGYGLKEEIKEHLASAGHEIIDVRDRLQETSA